MDLTLAFIYASLAVTLLTVDAAKYLSEKPAFLNPCSRNDANYDQCNAKNFQVLFTEWRNGVPGLKTVGPVDPLEVKRVRIKHDGNNLISLQAELKNLIITGGSKTVIKSAIINPDSYVVKIHIPKLRFDGDYRAKGSIFSFPLNSEGDGYAESENSFGTISGKLKLRRDGDLVFMDLLTMKVAYEGISDFRIHLNNLFGGQKDLEDTALALINDNWRDLYEVLRPVLEETTEVLLKDRLKKIFNFVPANYFLADL